MYVHSLYPVFSIGDNGQGFHYKPCVVMSAEVRRIVRYSLPSISSSFCLNISLISRLSTWDESESLGNW